MSAALPIVFAAASRPLRSRDARGAHLDAAERDQHSDAAAWLPADSREGRDVGAALQFVARWTRTNHALIHDEFLHRVGLRPLAQLGNEHKFVWQRGDHGKGATPAWRDAQGRPLLGLIPLNMAREILIVLGGDNDEFLSFCPYGAGCNLSREAMLAPYRDAEGDIDPARVKQVLAETTGCLDIAGSTARRICPRRRSATRTPPR